MRPNQAYLLSSSCTALTHETAFVYSSPKKTLALLPAKAMRGEHALNLVVAGLPATAEKGLGGVGI